MEKAWLFGLAMAALVLGAALPGQGQEPVLVRDVATGPTYLPSSYASPPVRFRGEDYFRADDGFLGYELWATNGTPRGTRLVADLCPGRCSGGPGVLTPSGELLYFIAGNTTFGFESFWIWRSDGTAAGTFPLVDLEMLGFGAAFPVSFFAPFRDGVVFIVYDRARRGWSLWGSDGTRSGTREIAPLPGRLDRTDPPSNYDWPRTQDDPRKHYFAWQGTLWATDGTAAGTGPVSTPVRPCGGWARVGRLVVYAGEDAALNCAPWVSDGTARGTQRLKDVYPASFVAAAGLVYFTAYDGHGHGQLWKTNGTSRGTMIVRALGTRGLGKVLILGVAGSRVYFAADDGEHGIELWRTDGTPASTALVADLSPGTADTYFPLVGGRCLGDQLFFVAMPSGASMPGVFRTRGSAASTAYLAGLGFEPATLSVAGGRVYFVGTFPEVGRELGVTDGTVEGTHVLDLAQPVASSNPHRLIAGRGGLVFLADDGGEFGIELWRSGGHRWDTELLADLVPGRNDSDEIRLVPGSGGALYSTFSAQFGWTDGQTIHGLLPPGTFAYPEGFVDLGDRTLFFAPRWLSATAWQPWLWSSDGTVEGTAPAAPTAAPGTQVEVRAALVPQGGEVRFLVQDNSSYPLSTKKLMTTDGTADGTRELVSIPVRRHESVAGFVATGSSVFASFWSESRASLWASDGTAEGTREVYAVNHPYQLAFISELTAAGEQAFFLGVDGEHGRELWVSDGTPEGTRLLEIQPGPRGSYPQDFRVIGDRAVFAADDGVHGLELWVTDGTQEGTRLVADVMAGPRPSSPRDFAVYGGDLFFNAGRPREGYELWKLPLEALEP